MSAEEPVALALDAGVRETLAKEEPDGEGESKLEGVPEGELESEPEGEPEAAPVRVGDTEAAAELLCVRDGEDEALRAGVSEPASGEGDPVAVGEEVAAFVAATLAVEEPLPEGVEAGLTVSDADAEPVADGLNDGLEEALADEDADAEPVADGLEACDGLKVCDGLAVGLKVALADEDAVPEAAGDVEGAPLALAAADAAEEAEVDADGEPVAVGLVQNAEPAAEKVPPAQGVQPAALAPGLDGAPKKPASQMAQLLAAALPAAVVVVPSGQAEHALRPATAA